MSKRYQGGVLGVGFNPLRAPDAPTIGTATSPSGTTASVAFTAPANVGGSPITSYAVQSTPDGIGATGSSSPITVSGLTTGTAYTFRVTALNSYGPSPASAPSNSVTPVAAGQQAYTTAGTYSWVAPAGVTSVSVVAVGGGSSRYTSAGGSGGGLGYKNNINVTPGSSYTVVVGAGVNSNTSGNGGDSYFNTLATVKGGGGIGGTGGTFTGDGGGNGGGQLSNCFGGGGAGGYSGNGGAPSCGYGNGFAGTGGGGGGGGQGVQFCYGQGGPGGGVGILGLGSSGAGGTGGVVNPPTGGGGGSGGTSGVYATSAGVYGGGAGISRNCVGTVFGSASGCGAVRIIWPGTTRSFPSTNTGNL